MVNCVCALIFMRDGILAVSRKDNPNDFGLPGGKLELSETFEDALVREVLEETGLHVRVLPCYYEALDLACNHLTRTYICYPLSTIPEPVSESGIIDVVSPQTLLDGSFGDYNEKLFKHFNIIPF